MASAARSALILSLLLSGSVVGQSQEKETNEPVMVVELGGAASHSITENASSFGPSLALEVTPKEGWLELEVGVMPLMRRHSTEWNSDLLFKKPWTLSPKTEFMIGAGPEWIHSNEIGRAPNSVGGEAGLDFMFWQSAKHRFGWYLEPAYDYNFGRGHEQSLGVTAGVLIGIR